MAALTRGIGVVAVALSACAGSGDAGRLSSTEFEAGGSAVIDTDEAGGPVLVDVGYAFEVGALDVDFLPGDVNCVFTGSLAGIEARDRSESRSDALEAPFQPIGVWSVASGAGEISCGHFLGQQVELRVDLWEA